MSPCHWSHAPLAAIAVVSRPHEVIATPLPCIDHQPPITIHVSKYRQGISRANHKVTSIHRSRYALSPLHKYFGLYHALTNLYPSRHALGMTKHSNYNAPLPGYCPHLPIGHRPQVAAGLLANSNTPALGRCRTSTRFHSRCVHGYKLASASGAAVEGKPVPI